MDNSTNFEDFDIEVNEVSQSNTEVTPEEPIFEIVRPKENTECNNVVDSEANADSPIIEQSEQKPIESSNSNDLIAPLLERIESLSEQNELLLKKFDNKIAVDEHKAQLFDKMYAELANYKKDLYAKLLGPFINETISLLNDYEKLVEKIDSIDHEKLVKYVVGIPDDLETLLDNNGVERYCDDTKKFNPKTQRVLKTIPTGDVELDNIIAERIRKGYRWNGVMLKPEMVYIFKFQEGYVEPVDSDKNNCNQDEVTPSTPETIESTVNQE